MSTSIIRWNYPFQSTLPAGEATYEKKVLIMIFDISIHASRGGSDSLIATHWQAAQGFQSTLPAGEATAEFRRAQGYRPYFNPRFPRGKRPSPAG